MTHPGAPFVASLLGLVAGAWLAACAAKSPGSAAAPSRAMGDLEHRGGHDPAIEALDQQIARDLDSLGIDPPSDAEVAHLLDGGDALPMPLAVAASSTCDQPPEVDACRDVCTLATAICDNARQICELAADLDGDDWAAQRCVSGKASCTRATARCCAC